MTATLSPGFNPIKYGRVVAEQLRMFRESAERRRPYLFESRRRIFELHIFYVCRNYEIKTWRKWKMFICERGQKPATMCWSKNNTIIIFSPTKIENFIYFVESARIPRPTPLPTPPLWTNRTCGNNWFPSRLRVKLYRNLNKILINIRIIKISIRKREWSWRRVTPSGAINVFTEMKY